MTIFMEFIKKLAEILTVFFLQHLNPDLVDHILSSLTRVEEEMKRVYEIGGLPHFQAVEDEVTLSFC